MRLCPSCGEAVSTPELIRAVARAMGRPARLLAMPVEVLELVGTTLLGQREAVARLTGSLDVDSSAIRSRGWTPPFSMEAGLAATVAASA